MLVQPGRPDAFNDYRFPSKLPEFLASGRPVMLPRTNIGLHLEDGVEALLLGHGDADEIADKVDGSPGTRSCARRSARAGGSSRCGSSAGRRTSTGSSNLYGSVRESEASQPSVG